MKKHHQSTIKNLTVPEYYRQIIKTMTGKIPTTPKCSFPLLPNHQFNPRAGIIHLHQKSTIIPETNSQIIQLWTDGSFKPNKAEQHLGCAAIIAEGHRSNQKLSTHQATLDKGFYPSSTRAELGAIFIALHSFQPDKIATIYTDSLTAMNQINQFNKNLTIRNQLKHSNHLLLQNIKETIGKLKLIVDFSHVKAHTNNSNTILNEEADLLAKNATNGTPLNYFTMSTDADNFFNNFLYHNNKIVEYYPAYHIKKSFRKSMHLKNREHLFKNLTLTFPNDINDMSWKYTMEATLRAAPKMNGSRVNDLKFRTNLFNRRLPIGRLLNTYKTPSSPYCPFCNQIEDILHLWSCPNTIKQYESIKKATFKTLKKRYELEKTDPSIQQIIEITEILNPNFLKSITAKGIISNTQVEHIQKHSYNKIQSTTNLINLIDSFLSTFQKLIWVPRCTEYKKISKLPPTEISPGTDPPSTSHE